MIRVVNHRQKMQPNEVFWPMSNITIVRISRGLRSSKMPSPNCLMTKNLVMILCTVGLDLIQPRLSAQFTASRLVTLPAPTTILLSLRKGPHPQSSSRHNQQQRGLSSEVTVIQSGV